MFTFLIIAGFATGIYLGFRKKGEQKLLTK